MLSMNNNPFITYQSHRSESCNGCCTMNDLPRDTAILYDSRFPKLSSKTSERWLDSFRCKQATTLLDHCPLSRIRNWGHLLCPLSTISWMTLCNFLTTFLTSFLSTFLTIFYVFLEVYFLIIFWCLFGRFFYFLNLFSLDSFQTCFNSVSFRIEVGLILLGSDLFHNLELFVELVI